MAALPHFRGSAAKTRRAAQSVILAERTLEVAEQTFDAQRARFELGEAIPMVQGSITERPQYSRWPG